MIEIKKSRHLPCADCDEEGIYHIQWTEEDYWLCKKHMIEASENTAKINELSLNELYATQNMEMVK